MASALRLDDEAADLLVTEARRRGVKPEDLAREAIEAYLAPRPRRLGFVALGDTDSGFRAADAEEVLESEFGNGRP
jgi:hypothetical protein